MSDVTSSPSRPQSPVAGSVYGMNDLPTSRPYRFVWDPSTRRPGPESVAGTTEGGRDYINGQYPLGVLNNPSSLNLELSSIPSEWSSAKHGFNAISTVLNHPHKRHAPPKAHSSLPSVPPADLPRVRRKDFDSYLKAITPEWEKYQQNSQLGKEGQAQIDAARFAIPEEDEGDEEEDEGDEGTRTPRKPAPLSFQGKQIPPLESVPIIFFEQNLNLGDRATFDAVTELSAFDPVTPTPSSVRTRFTHPDGAEDDGTPDPLSPGYSLPLLDKFSQYADTVEQHLIREISIRSTSFFAALTNLRELQTSSTECLTRIQSLREKLKQVDEGTAKKGLELVRVKRKEDRVKEVADGIKMISGVVEMVSVAKGLVSAGQWGEALEVVEGLEEMWDSKVEEEKPPNQEVTATTANGTHRLETMSEDGEEESLAGSESVTDNPPPNALSPPISTSRLSQQPVSLSSLSAFASLPAHLQKFTMEIAASLSAEFVAIMKEDWTSYVESDRPLPTSDENDSVANAGRDKVRDQSLEDRLKPLLLNLVRTKGLKEGMLSWREVILVEFKNLVIKKVPVFALSEDDASANGDAKQALAAHVKGLSQTEFNDLLKGVYKDLLGGIERLKAQGDVIQELLASPQPSFQQKAKPYSTPPLEEDLADILSSTSELANTQVAKIVSCRAELHSKLELAQFMAFFNESWAFVVRCEVLSRRMIVGLRGTIVSQAKVWLQTFHQARITQSAKLVEDEVWNPISEVTRELQHTVNIIVDGAVKDAPDLVISLTTPTQNGEPSAISPSSPSAPPQSALPSAGPNTATSSRPSGKTKQIRIEERTYYVVPATSQILTLVLDYLRVIVNMTMLTTDTMSRVIEFLKAFNSRTCQVVLGAGAMRSAGLKNITAKHLALASQSLSIIFELIPYVREAFRRHLNQKQAVMLVEFDKLKRDYQEHQNEIHAKLIAIMSERLDSHIKTLKVVDWNVPREGGGANDYMVRLVKETVTLHTILSRYLRADIVEYVMSEVLAAINHRLSEEYGRIDLPSIQAKEQLLEDTRFLHQNFSPLKHVKAPTAMLETVVAEKPVPRPPGSAIPPTPTRSNTLNANQRLRGLLSGRVNSNDASASNPARATPTPPISEARSPPQPSSPPQAPISPSLGTAGSSLSNGLATLGIHSSASRSSMSVATSEDNPAPQQGFRQVGGRPSEDLNGSGPPLPPKPGDLPS